jgi:hypothetical protein
MTFVSVIRLIAAGGYERRHMATPRCGMSIVITRQSLSERTTPDDAPSSRS